MLSTYSITPDLITCLKCAAEEPPAPDGPGGIRRLCVDMISELAVLETPSVHQEEQEVVDELMSPAQTSPCSW